ncbi:hypothetical protein CQW23_05483 [Capsicum baccatum]|uniref:Uncharacterized protein n=1 Tax=Capsicum baccatum TaxID=33114 RepID=A0A2G2XHP6_CAPBA|nr:hypothetical protein CQW23_05483 [Capsicum baccatum]
MKVVRVISIEYDTPRGSTEKVFATGFVANDGIIVTSAHLFPSGESTAKVRKLDEERFASVKRKVFFRPIDIALIELHNPTNAVYEEYGVCNFDPLKVAEEARSSGDYYYHFDGDSAGAPVFNINGEIAGMVLMSGGPAIVAIHFMMIEKVISRQQLRAAREFGVWTLLNKKKISDSDTIFTENRSEDCLVQILFNEDQLN